ncbi:sulfurtransferase TusA family protein [Hoeflea sp. YIM 152468]|uniref:sulfurtransferase TusA family protein n=1 Tax=Hoeflea sp. YIM 152468 TaxID=3031759 RepID=UPI0023DA77C8|nr:sulfurtransferase TusA family protein [Hoeflea sp. YIM 152468]MDF1608080.1 sulfurtransferase TusA family protein [Hoeflea sp. YIM 152468]
MSRKDGDALDLRGLKCPLPVLKTRKHMRDLASGSRIVIATTDPLAVIDIPHFCRENGHRLLSSATVDGGHSFVIEKG